MSGTDARSSVEIPDGLHVSGQGRDFRPTVVHGGIDLSVVQKATTPTD